MQDEQIVQPEAVPEGTPSESGDSGLEALDKQLKEMVKAAVDSQLPEIKEELRRRYQSEKDAEIARERRRLRDEAEQTVQQVGKRLQESDPDAHREFEADRLKRERDELLREQQTARQKEQADKFWADFYENLEESAKIAEISPDDKRLDWGRDAKTPMEIQKRFMASVAKIVKEERSKVNQDVSQLVEEKLREYGFGKHDMATPAGAAGDDAAFYEAYGNGEVPATPENAERAKRIYEQRIAQT